MARLERIVAACGGLLLDNGRRALIPGPDHSRKDRSVSLIETEDGRIIIHCFSPRDDWRAVRRSLAAKGLLDGSDGKAARTAPRLTPPRIVAQPAQEDRVARARRLWEQSRPLTGSVAEAYLLRRAISKRVWNTDALRFHPRITGLDDRARRPALIVALRDALGEVQGVQATLLSPRGAGKADVPTPRRVIGKLMGGVVRLDEPSDELAIGEGVETMLSAASELGVPAWAALTAGNLERFTPPPGLKRLIIAADNDAAGHAAAKALKERLTGLLSLEIACPPDGEGDWNDLARRAMH